MTRPHRRQYLRGEALPGFRNEPPKRRIATLAQHVPPSGGIVHG